MWINRAIEGVGRLASGTSATVALLRLHSPSPGTTPFYAKHLVEAALSTDLMTLVQPIRSAHPVRMCTVVPQVGSYGNYFFSDFVKVAFLA